MSSPLALGPVRPVPLSAINPVAQLGALGVVLPVLLVSGDLLTPLVLLAAEVCLLPAAGLGRPRALLARTWPLLLGAAGVAWVNVLFGDADAGGWSSAVALAVRVLALALPGVLLVASTDPVRLADALTLHWRVSTRFAYGALAALRLVPLLATEWQTIRQARRARGIEPGRNPVAHARLFAGTAFGLLVGAVRRGTRLATAMDARGFDSGVPRSNARGSRLRARDAAYLVGAVVVCLVAVLVSVRAGSWHPVLG
ncbi:energy-coupling factor transporter transmembrane protein EcfT [Blastococcus sp. TML/M2B]|uniref:energy-coupling factor transporter transmembrane component T family protein n=1 Tax=unclassified Blastococcus TaxID=2619396 RepID=UPI00190AD9B0|nr:MULTISPECIES: energy-coupling factor transporter transmembrane component T [unclassified Blastococcus]MBN1094413.1 energy-coupling factor transporter transmembrane protein EcfT [Blastococcus sp. TML/M2B]MBN1095372.1 energy-coupling factor transporter transmembrane protein EcfT [Blastococcus sp. TML/C7B]